MTSSPKTLTRRAIALGTTLALGAGALAPLAHADDSTYNASLSNKTVRHAGQKAPVDIPGNHLQQGQTIRSGYELVRYTATLHGKQSRSYSKQKLTNLTAPKGYVITGLGIGTGSNVGFSTHDDYGQDAMRVALFSAPKATSDHGSIYVLVRKGR